MTFQNFSISAFIILNIFFCTLSAETGINSSSKPKAAKNELPRCVNDPAEIQGIKDAIKANSKTEFKYKGYREAFKSETDVQILARLVYAETLATNCSSLNGQIVPQITRVIANRVVKRKEKGNGDALSVVFQRDQFASSMNIYDSSKYLDFLCPKDQKLWDMAYNNTVAALGSVLKNKDSVHYFLYKHDPRWTKEPASWNFEEDTSYTTPELQACIRIFKNPKWQ